MQMQMHNIHQRNIGQEAKQMTTPIICENHADDSTTIYINLRLYAIYVLPPTLLRFYCI